MGPPNGAFQSGTRGLNFSMIRDGLSNTLLVGEKHVPVDQFAVTPWDGSVYNGHYPMSYSRGAGPLYPIAKSPSDPETVFGSYHPGLCQFVFGDGHVRPLENTLNPNTLGLLANIFDGQVLPEF